MADKGVGMYILRLFFGVAFVIAGIDKVFSFGMVQGMFGMLFGGAGTLMLVLAILIEIFGGIGLIFGYHTRKIAAVLGLLIIVAFVTTFKLGEAAHIFGTLREITVMNTGGGNTAVNFAYFAALLSLALSGSRYKAMVPD